MNGAERSKIGRGSVLGSTRLGEIGRRSWVTPLLAAIVLGAVGYWAASTIERSMKADLKEELTTLSDAAIAAVSTWLEGHRRVVTFIAGNERVREHVQDQIALDREKATKHELLTSKAFEDLQKRLKRIREVFGYEDFAIVTPQGRNIASTLHELVGEFIERAYSEILTRVNAGESVVSPPMLPDNEARAGFGPAIVIAAPVRNDAGDVVALLGFTVPPKAFTDILLVATRRTGGA